MTTSRKPDDPLPPATNLSSEKPTGEPVTRAELAVSKTPANDQLRDAHSLSGTPPYPEAQQEADTVPPEILPAQFVRWFREVAPYVHAFRGKTFVVAFGGELVQAGALNSLVQDLSLLSALGIRLVLVHGSRPQVNEQLRLKGIEQQFNRELQVTDADALECAKEAAGEILLDIEAAFSQGLPNTPMSHARMRVITGNFVTARPVGVIDGVDYRHTGLVRKIDTEALRFAIDHGSIVLMSPLGFSPTGEAFRLEMEELAT